ncbi:MAG: DUF899 family protein [Candidatus Hydrogenedentota bacterium]
MSDARQAILEIREAELELVKAREKVLQLRRSVEGRAVKNYKFGTPDGPKRMADLFDDKEDLIVIHNMGKSCTYCTLWGDGFNGLTKHFEDRAAFVVASPDSVEVQQEFAKSRGCTFKMVSCENNNFFDDMGFLNEKERPQPGISTFSKDYADTITRAGAANIGPGDDFCSTWHILDILKDGDKDWEPKYQY